MRRDKENSHMVMNRKPLAAVAVGALLVTVAGCGGGSSSGGGNDSAEGTKGGTLYHLTERAVEHTDPSRTYIGRDIFNFNRTVYRSWVSAPVTTDEKEAATVVLRDRQRRQDGVEVHRPRRREVGGRQADHL
jgi:hypothetical protein